MKKAILAIIVACLFGCTKDKKTVLASSYTFDQAFDTLHLQYEKKYWFTQNVRDTPYFIYSPYTDTIVFHTNGSITESTIVPNNIFRSITFSPWSKNYGLPPSASSPNGYPYLKYFLPNDTAKRFILHDEMLVDTASFSYGFSFGFYSPTPFNAIYLNQ